MGNAPEKTTGCFYCDIGCDAVMVDGKPVHPITNPTENVPCERKPVTASAYDDKI